ncbi:MAG: MBL fold metallo-hydrolase [Alphaproteobacteria bacterium]|nr:MBL fold metallo-hydrolase [Alphaproteobacteria bacterium]
MNAPKNATEATRKANQTALLPKEDGQDAARVDRGFMGTIADATIPGAWSMAPYGFLDAAKAPDTVHPGLWRQARLNARHGLFEVTPGIYQVRGFDLSNITFVEGERGYLVIDPLISAEPAAAALALMRAHRGDKPVTGVIYTHSHVDHYGGVRGVLSDADIAAGLEIVAPEGFLKAAVSENVLAGNAMGRRATYMYGSLLPRGPEGHVDCGLGKSVSLGQVSLVPPTRSIGRTGERLTLDGVEIVFQVTPDTEAPAEMNFFFPRHRALCMAENCSCQLHNIYTPRGAQVRDAKAWSHYIDEARRLFGGETDVVFASHHWPRWGGDEADLFLRQQRDLYKFIHDQTLRLANHGLVASEIAERLELPSGLRAEWHTRGYYGTLSHNAKAVYQRYLGWFDGNPAHLNPHPPEAAGRRYVDLAGGAEALLAKARVAFEAGDYRWVAEVVNHLVFADPDNVAARELQADALEQLGYQAESGPWRDFYLTGAMELRNPRPAAEEPRQGALGQLRDLPADELLDSLSVRLDAARADTLDLALTLAFTDVAARFALRVENAVLRHAAISPGELPHETELAGPEVRLSRADLIALVSGALDMAAATASGRVAGPGAEGLAQLLACLDRFDFWFNIVLP